MIPNNTKSGIISIIRFSGEIKHSTFSAASFYGTSAVNAAQVSAFRSTIVAASTKNRHSVMSGCQRGNGYKKESYFTGTSLRRWLPEAYALWVIILAIILKKYFEIITFFNTFVHNKTHELWIVHS